MSYLPDGDERRRVNRFDRLLGILLHLRSGRASSAGELARRFEVSARTIYRDVDLLSALGVPVYAERGRGGGLRLLPGFFLPPIMFTTGEAVSLAPAIALLRSLRTRPFAADLETAEKKLLAAIPEDLRAVMAAADRLIGFEGVPGDAFHRDPAHAGSPTRPDEGPAAAPAEAAAIDAFLQGVLQRRRVRLRYQAPYRAAPTELAATPLGLFWDRDRWYLVGHIAGEARDHRLWRADRVLRVALAERDEEARPDFDVRALLDRAWLARAMRQWADEAPVRIRLSQPLAERLRRDWYYRHARYEPLPDGRVMLTFGEDEPAAALELLRWLGPEAELIEPAAWRAMLRDDLRAMLAAHADERPATPADPTDSGSRT
jgi:predicted DNA-binding transcriptional regulator YafY